MNRLLSVTFMTGLLTLLKMLMGFIIAKVVAIYTGPTGMAMLGQLQSAVTGLNGIVSSPVGNGIIRYTAENNGKDFVHCSPWWRASIQWVAVIFLIIAPLGFLFASYISEWLFHSREYRWLISLLLISLPFATLGTAINSVINGNKNYKRYVFLGMISVFISSVFMIILIAIYGLHGALIAASIQYPLIGLVMLLTNLNQPWIQLKYWIGKSSKIARRQMGSYIFMAVTAAVMTPVALVLIRNILIAYTGWEVAGQWQAVWKISEVYLGVITIAFSTYYLPHLSSFSDQKSIIKEIHHTALIVVPIAAALALIVYLLRDFTIDFLFTTEFRDARNLFAIQLFGDVIKIASWVYAYPMLSRGATKWFVYSEVFFSITLVLLAFILIPIYGAHGANYAYLVNYIVYLFFVVLNLKKITA